MTKNIMIVGVGGQGSLLASKLMGNVLMAQDINVKVSEVHGMSQRGGSVVTYVKYGENVFSPVIDKGEADFILAFERLEAARWVSYLKQGGRMIINDRRISPMPVITGAMEYPEDIVAKLKDKGACITSLDALELASRAGSPKAVNIVLLGVLSRFLDFPQQLWLDTIAATVPERFLEMNLSAFKAGKNALD